ncbi:hypothetical protein HY404_01180 [Candidatus Microgenomates bacterium]|nr:hypothetical protein [Candidatus Microgenomates bacterium]
MQHLWKVLLIAFLLRVVFAFIVWHPDLNNHVDWGIRFWQYGPEKFYSQNVWSFSWPNQPPGTIIIFALVRKLFELIFNFFWWVNVNLPVFPSAIMLFFEERLYQALLKLPAILADLGMAYLIFKFLKGKLGLWGASLFLFNPVTWYNSAIWGQTDATVNFFSLLSIMLLLERKLKWSMIAIFTSLFIKVSLVIMVPILAMVAIKQKYQIKDWLKSILLAALIVGGLTLPFSKGEPFSWLVNLYQTKVFEWQLHIITANAFNLWATLAGIHERPDTLFLGPLTYHNWGLILFGLAAVPLLYKVYKNHDSKNIFWVATLIAFAAFTFLTGMHERYLYPLFPLFTILVAWNRKLLPLLVGISIIHLLNLYNFWWYPRVEWLVNLMSAGDRLLPRILGLITTAIFLWLYWYFFKTSKTVKK